MKTPLCLTLLTSVTLVTASIAADSSPRDAANPPAPTQNPPQAYTDQGTTRHETTSYNYNYNYPAYNSQYSSSFSTFDNFQTTSFRIQHRPIYYPPAPPPLGEAVFPRRIRASLAKFAPPNALAEDIYEPFYAPLSTLLFTEDLSKKRRERLDSYHANRTSLLGEIRAQLESLKTAEPSARESSLAQLATDQAARLTSLSTAAEELRRNYVVGSFFESAMGWNDTREWRLGDDTRWESALDEIKVMRGASAFQEGLSASQRRLLNEMAMELTDGTKEPTEEIALSTPGPFIYFSPETARIRLPASLPTEIAAKLDRYKEAKANLKKELRDLLYKKDRAIFESTRINAFKALAESQAPRFAEIEQLAEEIRHDLVPYPNPARPPALPLPAPLANRITAYNQKKSELQAMLVAKQEEVKNELPMDRVEFIRVSDAIVLNIVASRRSNSAQNQKRQEINESLVRFNQQQTKLYATLAKEKEVIRDEFNRIVSEMSGKKNIDQLQREFTYALKKQETWAVFRDYEIAVLEPGLSPAQRVLLFGAAIKQLDLPLAN